MNVMVLEFQCELTSPFMSRQHQYANLYTVSNWVLGSTLRGAMLRALIDRHCSRIPQLQEDNPGYHETCDADCSIRELFKPPTRFSFGIFDMQQRKGLRTRIGMNRATGTVAERMLLTMDVWHSGTFRFRVMLPSCEKALRQAVHTAVQEVGERPDDIGIGGFRGIGYGKFRLVGEPEVVDWEASSSEMMERRMVWEFQTPYVLDEKHGGAIPAETLQDALHQASSPEAPFSFGIEGSVRVMPTGMSYVRRWSDETRQKLNRVVLDPGSRIEVTFDRPIPETYLSLWQWGIGKWGFAGFGSFEVIPLSDW